MRRGGAVGLVLCAVVSATMAAGGVAQGAGPPAPPAADARVPLTGDLTVVHDPDTAVEDGTTYLYSTGPGIPIRRSTDQRSWEEIGRVFEPESLPPWATAAVPGAVDPWAPDLERFGGQWHLYYAVSTFGSTGSAIGHATNPTLDPDDPAYGWTDLGPVVTSAALPLDPDVEAEWNAIDPNVAVDDDGRAWLAWGSFAGGIKLRELDVASGAPIATAEVHTLARRVPWFFGVEAAHLDQRDGWWYLFTSWNFCCRGSESNYEVRVGRARSLTGPFLDRDGVPLVDGGGTLVLTGDGDVRGPGHSSMLVDGDAWTLVHHFYDAAADGVATLGMHRLTWTADGWPVVGMDPAAPSTTSTVPVTTTWIGTASTTSSAAKPLAASGAVAAPRFAG